MSDNAALARKLTTIAIVDVAVGLLGVLAGKKLMDQVQHAPPELVDEKLARQLFEDYKAAHSLETRLDSGASEKTVKRHPMFAGNAGYIPHLGLISGDAKMLKRIDVVAHEVGHARSDEAGHLSSLLYGPATAAGAAVSIYGALKGKPGVPWAATVLQVLPLYEEWRASGYAKEALEKVVSPTQAAAAVKTLRAAFGTYVAAALTSAAMHSLIGLALRRE